MEVSLPSTGYLASERSELVRYRVEHEKTTKQPRIIFFIIYLQEEDELIHVSYSFMALNRACDMSATGWLSQTHVKRDSNFSRVVIPFI